MIQPSSKMMRKRDWIAATVTFLLLLATFLPWIVPEAWWLHLLIFPQGQIAFLVLIAALAIPILIGLRRVAPVVISAGLLLALAFQTAQLLPFTGLWPRKSMAGADECLANSRMRVLVLNVKKGDPKNASLISLVREMKPDIFLALETEPEWFRRAAALRNEFLHEIAVPRADAWGMGLFSNLPLEDPQIRYLVDDYVPSIRTGVRLPSGKIIGFYGLHPKPPLSHDPSRGDAELLRAAREIAASFEPAILAGDLNDVPWGATTQQFQKISGMSDPRVGRAFDATFRLAPLLKWPLDHVYATPHFRLLAFDPLRDVGSDHLPLLAEMCLS